MALLVEAVRLDESSRIGKGIGQGLAVAGMVLAVIYLLTTVV